MGMKVIRDDSRDNTTREVAGYGDITLHIGNAAIESLAQQEATENGLKALIHDVHLGDGTVRHCVTLRTSEDVEVALYYGEWVEDEEEDEGEEDETEELERDSICEVCLRPFCAADLEDGVTVAADCCWRTGMCAECRQPGLHDCDEDMLDRDDDEDD